MNCIFSCKTFTLESFKSNPGFEVVTQVFLSKTYGLHKLYTPLYKGPCQDSPRDIRISLCPCNITSIRHQFLFAFQSLIRGIWCLDDCRQRNSLILSPPLKVELKLNPLNCFALAVKILLRSKTSETFTSNSWYCRLQASTLKGRKDVGWI